MDYYREGQWQADGIIVEFSMGALDVAAAIATVASLFLALWQYLVARHVKLTERERIVLQRERLRMAVASAVQGAEAANLIVQRAKDADATNAELQNMARIIRGSLIILARQLEQERSLLTGWKVGGLMRSAPPDHLVPDIAPASEPNQSSGDNDENLASKPPRRASGKPPTTSDN